MTVVTHIVSDNGELTMSACSIAWCQGGVGHVSRGGGFHYGNEDKFSRRCFKEIDDVPSHCFLKLCKLFCVMSVELCVVDGKRETLAIVGAGHQ